MSRPGDIRAGGPLLMVALLMALAISSAACGGDEDPGAAEEAAQRATVAAPGLPPGRADGAARLALAGQRLHPSVAGELTMLDVATASGGVERVIETGDRRVTSALRLEHLVVTCGGDGRLAVWRPRSGALLGEARTPQPLVRIAQAPGLPLLAAADSAGAVELVDLGDPRRPRPIPLPRTAGRGPALAVGFSQDSSQVLVVRSGGELERFATLGGRPQGRVPLLGALKASVGGVGRLTAAEFYSEGVDEKLLVATDTGTVARIDLQRMSAVMLLAPGTAPGRITSLAKAPYGELAAATPAGLVRLENASAVPTVERGAALSAVAFDSEDELWVAGAEGVGRRVETFETASVDARPALGLTEGSGGILALGHGGSVSILGPSGSGLMLPEAPSSPVLAFAPGGGLLLAAGYDANHIEDLYTVLPGHRTEHGVEVTDPELRSYRPASGWWPQVEEGSGLYLNDVTEDHRFLVAGGQDPTGEAVVLVWDAKSGRPLHRLPLSTGGVEPGEPSIVSDLALLPSRHLLVAYSTVQQSIVIWSTDNWQVIASLPVGRVGQLAVSPDESTILAVGLSEDEEAVVDGTAASKLIFIDTSTRQIDEEVLTGDVDRAAFSPDGEEIALLGIDGTLRLRGSDGREELRAPIQLESEPVSLAWRPDGALIAVGLKEDGVVLVGPRLGSVSPSLPAGKSTVFDLGWSEDGRFLADSPSVLNDEDDAYEPQATQIWALGASRLERRMCQLSGGPIGRDEWRALVDPTLPYRGLCRAKVATGSPANPATEVVLGSRAFELNGEGWGTAEPPEIFNGGDPSGLVDAITWRHWGAPIATGSGLNSIFKPTGGYYAKQVRVELRAVGLGHCGIFPAYTRLEVRTPRRPGGPLGPWFSWARAGSLCRSAG